VEPVDWPRSLIAFALGAVLLWDAWRPRPARRRSRALFIVAVVAGLVQMLVMD
jgi:hypothetical protein